MNPSRVCGLGLLALAGVQALALGKERPNTNSESIGVGTDLSGVRFTSPDGTVRYLATGTPILALVFDPECVHSDRVAADWAQWLRDSAQGLQKSDDRWFTVIALSASPAHAAAAYGEANSWGVAVGTGDGALVRRTPWVFALGRGGRVVAEGHGSKLREVAASLTDHIARTNHTGSPSWRSGSSQLSSS